MELPQHFGPHGRGRRISAGTLGLSTKVKQSMGYRQLTQTQRYRIHARYDLGTSHRQICRELDPQSSMIIREFRHNATVEGYGPEQAQTLSDHRHYILD